MVAHVGGVPVEEMLLPVLGAGGSLALARVWMTLHLRRMRDFRGK